MHGVRRHKGRKTFIIVKKLTVKNAKNLLLRSSRPDTREIRRSATPEQKSYARGLREQASAEMPHASGREDPAAEPQSGNGPEGSDKGARKAGGTETGGAQAETGGAAGTKNRRGTAPRSAFFRIFDT